MEVANFRSLEELGIDHGFVHQTWQLNSLDELNAMSMAAIFGEHNYHMHPSQAQMFNQKHSLEFSQDGVFDRPVKQQKTNSWDSSNSDHISNPQIIDASSNYHVVNSDYSHHQSPMVKPKKENIPSTTMNFPHDIMVSQGSAGNQNYVFKHSQGAKRITTNSRLTQAQDHILAERKRREKLSQRFIQLSALVPGLKKMDKASILGDSIKYLKQLQEKVKKLEEQTMKKTMESVVFVKKYEIYSDNDNSSSNENSSDPTDETLPEIEARFSDKNVLVRIHCEKRKGILDKTVAEIEKLHLSVVNSSVMSFGNSVLDMTIIAEMDEEFNMPMKDLVKNLLDALKKFL